MVQQSFFFWNVFTYLLSNKYFLIHCTNRNTDLCCNFISWKLFGYDCKSMCINIFIYNLQLNFCFLLIHQSLKIKTLKNPFVIQGEIIMLIYPQHFKSLTLLSFAMRLLWFSLSPTKVSFMYRDRWSTYGLWKN